MKRNFFTPVLLLLGLFFSIGLVSCGEGAPDLSKKERDPRLIGAWSLENKDASFSPKTKHIEFKADGSCVGFSYPGGKRLFYTEGNNRLFVFVYGNWLKYSSRFYELYYLFDRNTLYIWVLEEDMLARKYDRALAYTKTSKP